MKRENTLVESVVDDNEEDNISGRYARKSFIRRPASLSDSKSRKDHFQYRFYESRRVTSNLRSASVRCRGHNNNLGHPQWNRLGARNAETARLVLGSANLTIGGLNSNIEASVTMALDMVDEIDAEFVTDIEAKIAAMIEEFPEHVISIADLTAVM